MSGRAIRAFPDVGEVKLRGPFGKGVGALNVKLVGGGTFCLL